MQSSVTRAPLRFRFRSRFLTTATASLHTHTTTNMSPAQPPPPPPPTTQQQRDITIIGGGIIGCCTAYFLTRHPLYSPATHRITLLEASPTSSGGRTGDSTTDPAALAGPPSGGGGPPPQPRNPAHDGIAGGASGKAGGLLALWAFPSSIVPLSFGLHDELAREHGGASRWGYRRCYASQVECRARLPGGLAGGADGGTKAEGVTRGLHKDHRRAIKKLEKMGAPGDLDWLDAEESLEAYEGMGTPDDTAQVHPELFTRSMAQLAEDAGVRIVTGARVTGINTDDGGGGAGKVQSVSYVREGDEGEQVLPTTDAVVAAGPWTPRLLPGVPVTASRAHSVVVRAPGPLSPYALFTSISLPAGFPAGDAPGPAARRARVVEPEIYARPDGTAYACGPTDGDAALPLTSAGVEVDRARCDDIVRQVGGVSDALGRDGEVLARQACYLPQGGPFIGRVPGYEGVVVAAGHTCWGIQNAPGTGKLVSEILLDGEARSARLGSCDASRVL